MTTATNLGARERIVMGRSQHWKFRMLVLVLAPAILAAPGVAQVSVPTVHFPPAGPSGGKVIIIGFVGGFVSRDDAKHPEVQFAAYLRVQTPSPSGSPMFGYLRRGFQRQIVASDQLAVGNEQ